MLLSLLSSREGREWRREDRGSETKILVDIFLPDALTANVRIPYLQRARPGARPGFVALRRHFGIYICCETFSEAEAPHDPICCPRFWTKNVIFLMGMM